MNNKKLVRIKSAFNYQINVHIINTSTKISTYNKDLDDQNYNVEKSCNSVYNIMREYYDDSNVI